MTVARIVNNSPVYLHADALGSPAAGTDSAGNVSFTERYTPFGISLVNNAATNNQSGYTGHIKDDDTGLVYMQARYYDPVIGRFYSNDPVDALSHLGGAAGIHGFNRYAYGNNNPYKFTDPTGMAPEFVDAIKEQVQIIAQSFGYDSPSQGNQNIAADSASAAKQVASDIGEAGATIVTNDAVQDFGDTLGYVPLPPAQAISTGLNIASLALEGDAAGLSGDAAGNAAGAQAEKSHAGKGGSFKAAVFNYAVDKAIGAVVSSTVEQLQTPEIERKEE